MSWGIVTHYSQILLYELGEKEYFPDFDSLKIPSLQLSEYSFVIKLRIFQGESLHFGYLCGHVYP